MEKQFILETNGGKSLSGKFWWLMGVEPLTTSPKNQASGRSTTSRILNYYAQLEI